MRPRGAFFRAIHPMIIGAAAIIQNHFYGLIVIIGNAEHFLAPVA
jgi:hypothetical protein